MALDPMMQGFFDSRQAANRQLQGIYDRQGQAQAAAMPEIQAANQNISQAQSAMANSAPQLPQAPSSDMREMSAMQIVGLIAAGLFAGRGSKQNWNYAAQALASGTAAYQKGQQEAYKQHMADYERNYKAAMGQWEIQRQHYQDIINKNQGDVTRKMAELKMAMEADNPAIKSITSQIQTDQDMMGLVMQHEQAMSKIATEHARQVEASRRADQQDRRLDVMERGLAIREAGENRRVAEHEAKYEGVPQQYLAEQFGWKNVPTMEPKEASNVADQVKSVKFMDRIVRSLRENPDLARKNAQLWAKASGSLDNYFSLAQETGDAAVIAFSKSMLDLTRAGALKIAGERGPTVTGDRIANKLLTEGGTPESLRIVAQNFARDFKASLPSKIDGQSLDWGAMKSLPTFNEEAEDNSPIIGEGFGVVPQPGQGGEFRGDAAKLEEELRRRGLIK